MVFIQMESRGRQSSSRPPACQAVPAAARLLPWGCSSLSPDCYQIAPPWVGQWGLEARPDLESGCGQRSPPPMAAFQLWAFPTSPARLPAAALLLLLGHIAASCSFNDGLCMPWLGQRWVATLEWKAVVDSAAHSHLPAVGSSTSPAQHAPPPDIQLPCRG